MKAAGCDVFVNTGIPKFAAQAIRKAAEIDWKPLHILSSVGNSVGAALKPAGLENAKGIVSDFYLKDPTDPAWKDDPGFKEWLAFMDKYYPDGDKTDVGNVVGYSLAQTMVQVLKQCGDNLTRENVMKEAANLKDFVAADAAARHQDQYQPDRLRPDQAGADGEIRRRALGAVRLAAERRPRLIEARGSACAAPGRPNRGVALAATRQSQDAGPLNLSAGLDGAALRVSRSRPLAARPAKPRSGAVSEWSDWTTSASATAPMRKFCAACR